LVEIACALNITILYSGRINGTDGGGIIVVAPVAPELTASVVEQPAAWGARQASAAGGAAAAGAAVAAAFATAVRPPPSLTKPQQQHPKPATTCSNSNINGNSNSKVVISIGQKPQ